MRKKGQLTVVVSQMIGDGYDTITDVHVPAFASDLNDLAHVQVTRLGGEGASTCSNSGNGPGNSRSRCSSPTSSPTTAF